MQDIRLQLKSYAEEYEIEISDKQAEKFQVYMQLLIEWNKKFNLTAITEPAEIAVKHFLDSILILKYIEVPENAKLIDIGTGAGFPGIPLKIMKPKFSLTLLDSLNKRLVFLSELTVKLNLNCELVHARAEEGGRLKEHRLHYDFAVARAVARLPVLCEYCLPYLKMGGIFVAMKGPDIEDELKSAKKAIELLGCETVKTENYRLPGGDGRSLVIIKRVSPLPVIYPRRGLKISKNPIA